VTCVWLLPFYPSPERDDGYDIQDYYGVNPRYGSLGEFVDFMHLANEHGIRVTTPDWSRVVDTMGKMIGNIEPLGMKAAIEAFATALTPMTTCLKFVEDCKPSYVSMCLDPRQPFRDEKGFDSLKPIGHVGLAVHASYTRFGTCQIQFHLGVGLNLLAWSQVLRGLDELGLRPRYSIGYEEATRR
jgi:hypothetical protein